MSPDTNQEEHGNEHHFPEKVKQEQICREKHATNTSNYPEQVEMVKTRPVLNFLPRCKHGHHAEEKSKCEKYQAQSIERKGETDTKCRNPFNRILHQPRR